MQELNYPNCVFYYIDIPEELEEWRIPQMLIHTVIETNIVCGGDGSDAHDPDPAEERTEKGERMLYLQIEETAADIPGKCWIPLPGKRRKTVEIRRAGRAQERRADRAEEHPEDAGADV